MIGVSSYGSAALGNANTLENTIIYIYTYNYCNYIFFKRFDGSEWVFLGMFCWHFSVVPLCVLSFGIGLGLSKILLQILFQEVSTILAQNTRTAHFRIDNLQKHSVLSKQC